MTNEAPERVWVCTTDIEPLSAGQAHISSAPDGDATEYIRAETAESRLAEAVKTLNACRGTFKRLKFEDESIAILAIDQTLAEIKGGTNDE